MCLLQLITSGMWALLSIGYIRTSVTGCVQPHMCASYLQFKCLLKAYGAVLKAHNRFAYIILLWCLTSSQSSSGTFKLTLQFTEDYPNKPPTVRFVSRMFHPNSMLISYLYFFALSKLVNWFLV